MRLAITPLALALFLSAPATILHAQVRSGDPVFDRTVQIVLGNFYRPAELQRFRDAVAVTTASLPNLGDQGAAVVGDAIDYVLQSLATSHTARYTPDSVAYYELLDVFRYGVRDGLRRLYPDERITYQGIGIATRPIGGAIFITDVYDGGPADRAGLLAGDEILSADGAPFQPIDSFRDKAGQTVTLSVRRTAGAAPMSVGVAVERLQPTETLIDAIRNSVSVVERDGFRLGVIRIWSYTDREVESVIEEALAGPLAEADGLILDLRSRWGGAPADAADSFVGGSSDMVTIAPNGEKSLAHARWRKPIVAIIDEGTRSGMEVLAFSLKQNGVRMVGTRTAGAVVAGRGFLLPDDSLLVLAVLDVYVDGTRLEGVGVEPDIAVPFDVRYAAGSDPQLDAAMSEMVRGLSPAVQ